MGEINLTINGRNFGISCDDGQERRVMELGHYVDSRVKSIAKAGAAGNELHMLALAALMLADEVFELRENVNELGVQAKEKMTLKQDEAVIAQAIDHLADRIDTVAARIQKA
jgi:cell division protein ZapA